MPEPLTTSDPRTIWSTALAAINERKGLAWLRNLTLRSIDAATARLAPLPGAREAAAFASLPHNRDTIEQLLGQITGRRIRIEIDAASAPTTATTSDEPATPAVQIQRGATREEREAAMNLPTVKELQQLFDVSLLDVKPDEGTDL